MSYVAAAAPALDFYGGLDPSAGANLELPDATPVEAGIPASHAGARDELKKAITDRLQAALDRERVPEERLQEWVSKEEQLLAEPHMQNQVVLPVPLRTLAMQFLFEITTRLKVPQTCWFQACHWLDTCKVNHEEVTLSPRWVLLRAAASWLVSLKQDESDRETINLATNYTIQMLLTWGAPVAADFGGFSECKETLVKEERLVLSQLLGPMSANLGAPTVLTWYGLFATRFHIATHGRVRQTLTALTGWVNTIASSAVFCTPISRASPPRIWAIGILGLALAASGTLPADTLRPHGVDKDYWGAALCWAQATAVVALAADRVPTPVEAELIDPKVALEALEFASGSPVTTVRRGAFAALSLVRPASS